ncbi:MAG: NlpC/P60 family protein [Pseudorhodobacter sp.]
MTPQQERILDEARSWIGTPYVHQASCKGAGADCLGLVRGVWRGVVGQEPEAVPPYSPDWGEAAGCELLQAAALRWLVPSEGSTIRPGEVLLFRMRDGRVAKHLGIASGLDSFIHAYSGHGVIENRLSGPWARRIVARFRFPLLQGAE